MSNLNVYYATDMAALKYRVVLHSVLLPGTVYVRRLKMSFGVLRRVLTARHAVKRNFSTSTTRNSDKWYYRAPPDPPNKYALFTAEVMGATMWWWVMWHLWTEPDHLTGSFSMPNPRKWTDAELGIPPDDED